MSASTEPIKSAHLGMPHGTAQNRLRKMIIFHLAQKLGEDFCFKCGQRIETAEELSIDHKVPWLHGDQALFWSMDNIAFSHRKCNVVDRPVGKKPKPGPEGTAWCVGCQAFLDVSRFWKNRSNWNGLQHNCRACIMARQKRKRAAG